jgi:hypothetical protein
MLHIHYRPAFVVYSITDLIIVFLVAFLSVIRSRIEMFQHNLPVLNTLLLSITVLLIITPPVAWAGASLGNKYGMKKQHNTSINTDEGLAPV